MSVAKPPYRVPLMAEIAKLPWNGRKVASTFSGGGGSCTGYRMAGFRVVWANEFVPIAQESYKANHPDSILDPRDIKLIKAQEILDATGLKVGELDVFDGSPPCQAFSTAGKREKGWAQNGGKAKKYDHGAEQHNEMLFFEYVRLLEGLQPRAFIAENVKGLTIGAAKEMMGDEQMSMFGGHKATEDGPAWTDDEDTILHQLMDAGYLVKWAVLDAKHHGVPQTRNRVIFMGIRQDLAKRYGVEPRFPRPLGYVYTVRDALPWIRGKVVVGNDNFTSIFGDPGKTSGLVEEPRGDEIVPLPPSRLKEGRFKAVDVDPEQPCPVITCASPGNDHAVPVITNRARGDEPARPVDLDAPAPTVVSNRGRQDTQFEVTERVAIAAVHDTSGQFSGGDETDKPAFAVTAQGKGQHLIVEEVRRELKDNPTLAGPKSGTGGYGAGGPTITGEKPCEAILAQGLGGVGHGQYDVESEVLVGTGRGFSKENWQSLDEPAGTIGTTPHCGNGMSPSGEIKVVTKRVERRDPETGASLELDESRLKVCDGTQEFGSAGAAATPDQPSPPILTPSNSAVVATERRKFTIAECKRICAFPDDYVLVGSYAKQWERLGNSVPPVFMSHIASELARVLDKCDAVHAVEPEEVK